MQVLIYHNKQFLQYTTDNMMGRPLTINPANLELVGKVNTDDLEEAFMLTNHLDQPWFKNDKVIWWRPARSTSTGDVLCLYDQENAKGAFSVVASFGFIPLNRHNFDPLVLERD